MAKLSTEDLHESLRKIKAAAIKAAAYAEAAHLGLGPGDRRKLGELMDELHHDINVVYENYDEGRYGL